MNDELIINGIKYELIKREFIQNKQNELTDAKLVESVLCRMKPGFDIGDTVILKDDYQNLNKPEKFKVVKFKPYVAVDRISDTNLDVIVESLTTGSEWHFLLSDLTKFNTIGTPIKEIIIDGITYVLKPKN